MAATPPNRISYFRNERKLTQQQLADKVGGVHWITISKLERGKIKLTTDWMDKISAALNVEPFDLVHREAKYRKLYIDGEVFPGGELGWIKDNEEEQEAYIEVESNIEEIKAGYWLIIGSNMFEPYIREGDLVRITPKRGSDSLKDMIGLLCWVQLKTAGIKQYLGFLQKGSANDTYMVERGKLPPIKDVEVEAAFPVTMILLRQDEVRIAESAIDD